MKIYHVNRKIILSIVALLFMILTAAGCGQTEKEVKNGAYTIVDDQGYKLEFDEKPQRIISYSLGIDEILLAMLPADRITALTAYVDNPEISNAVEAAKTVKTRVEKNNPEQILALKPDLVIMPDFVAADKIQSLREMGIKVYVFKIPGTIAEVEENIEKIGKLVGEEAKAKEMVEAMEVKLAKTREALGDIPEEKRLRVAFMGSTGVYYSPNASFSDVCRYAQVKDVTTDIKSNQAFTLSAEEVLKLKPATFVCASWNYDGKHSVEEQLHAILSNPAFADIPGVKNNNIIVVPGKDILSISQYIADGVTELAQKAYPEKFKN